MEHNDIVFIILNYKTFEDTIALSEEILSFENKFSFKIIIVDNDSPNNSYEIIYKKFINNPKIDVIKAESNQGYAIGNNYGLRHAKRYTPLYACVINNDVHFTSTTIENLIERYPKLESPAIISPIQYLPNNSYASFNSIEKIPSFRDDLYSYLGINTLNPIKYNFKLPYPNEQKVDIIPGAFLFISFKLFEELNFFDEDTFLFGEERLLAEKIKLRGLKNYIITSEKYIHAHSKTINKEASLILQRKLIFNGKLIYINKYLKNKLFKKILLRIAFEYNIILLRLAYIKNKLKNKNT